MKKSPQARRFIPDVVLTNFNLPFLATHKANMHVGLNDLCTVLPPFLINRDIFFRREKNKRE